MQAKLIEIRDEGTAIIALCVDMNPATKWEFACLRRYGFPCDMMPNIMLTHANGGKKANNDYEDWGDRTFAVAHKYITENWADIKDGDVVDVSFILGETTTKKISEVMPMIVHYSEFLLSFGLLDHNQEPVCVLTVLNINKPVGDCAAYRGIVPAKFELWVQLVADRGSKISGMEARELFPEIDAMKLRYRS